MPYLHTNTNTHCKRFEGADGIFEYYANLHRDWRAGTHCPPKPRRNHPPEGREDEYTSVADTIATVQCKEKERREDQKSRHKEAVTVDDNKLDAD